MHELLRRDQKVARFWLAAGAVILLVSVASITQADPDLWWHVRFGLDQLQTHSLPAIDPYSFTQDAPWISHEWFSELVMGFAFASAGTAGLALLKAALVASAALVVWRALSGTDVAMRMMAFGLATLGTGRITKTVRPQLWSFLCFVILCRVLVEDRSRGRRWLPLLFIVWANAHGGWLVGLGVLTLWAGIDGWSNPQRRTEWALIVPACALSTLCTPFGWTLWDFMWRTVGLTRAITEWQPIWTTPPVAWIPWLIAAAATIWAAAQPDPQRLARTAILTMLAYLALRVERIEPFFVTGSVLLLTPWLIRRWPDAASSTLPRPRLVAVTVLLVMAAGAATVADSSLRCINVEGTWTTDQEAARLLSSAIPGRLVTAFDWGDYAIFHWGPRLRVSMDARRETVYTERFMSEHDAVVNGTPEGLRTLDAWHPEYVWLPATSASTRQWLAGHGYRLEHDNTRSFVAVRGDLPRLVPIAASASGIRRCFPD